MTTLTDAVLALKACFAASAPFVDALNAVIAQGSGATVPQKNAAIRALLDDPPAHPQFRAWLSYAGGALVERGADPRIGVDRLLDWLAEGAAVLAAAGPALDEVDLDGSAPPPEALTTEERRWVAGFKIHVVGAMARLARDVESRKEARRHPRLAGAVYALEARVQSHHLRYITEILDMLDDEPLLVVDLPEGKVTRLRAVGIRNTFHLMTLLDGKDPFILAEQDDETVSEEHGYFTWPALAKDGGGRLVAERIGCLLWGEMRARDIAVFEGARAVLRTPKVFGSRSWSVGFVVPIHDALRESLVVEAVLVPGEARALLERMVRAAAG